MSIQVICDHIGFGNTWHAAHVFVADLAGQNESNLRMGARWLANTFHELPSSRKSDDFQWAAEHFCEKRNAPLADFLDGSRLAEVEDVLLMALTERYNVIKLIESPSVAFSEIGAPLHVAACPNPALERHSTHQER